MQALSMRSLSSFIRHHRHANWALADQSIVSGSNFVTGIVLARVLGPEAFGMFVLLQGLLLYLNSFQGALIFQPMMSAAPQLDEQTRGRYLQGMFAQQLVLTTMLAIGAGVVWSLAHTLGFSELVGIDAGVTAGFLAALLAFQLQDWQRRYYFVQENARASFFNDLVSYSSQICLLGVVTMQGRLDIASAFWIIAASSFIAFLSGFASTRLKPVFAHARSVLRDGWRTGRDYLMAWQLQWFGTQGVLMLGASVVGAQAAGGVRAAQNIVGPINILYQAMENVVPVVAARRFGQQGIGGLTRYLTRVTLIGSALLLPVLLTLTVFAEPLTHFLYGKHYAGSAALVMWQAGIFFVQFYYRQIVFFLRTVQNTSVIIRSGVMMTVTSLVAASLTVDDWHEIGVMFSLLVGTAAGFLYSLFAAIGVHRRMTQAASENGENPKSTLVVNLFEERRA